MSVLIRSAIPDDAGLVDALLAASYPALMAPAYDRITLAAALPLMTRANPDLLESGTFYVAQTREGMIIGCGGWTRARPGSGDIEPGLAHIRHFATHPRHVGRGIGRAIYNRCHSEARIADMVRFECYSSLNAEPFYAAVGFAPVRKMEICLADRVIFPCVLMSRQL
jgi:GNAT superfamily N-acetyltransferase